MPNQEAKNQQDKAAQPSPVELTRTWFERVWNQQDKSAIHEMMCTTCFAQGIGLEVAGPVGFIPFYENFVSVFDNMHIDIIDLTGDDNCAAGHGVFSGHHKKSGKDVSFEFSVRARWDNGLLVEARNVIDFLSLLEQIGEFDKATLASALEA